MKIRNIILLLAFWGGWVQGQDIAIDPNIVVLNEVEVRADELILKVHLGVDAQPFDHRNPVLLAADAVPVTEVLIASGIDRLWLLHDEGFANPALAAQLGMDRTWVASLAPGVDIGAAINALVARGDLFEVVEPNGIMRATLTPNDPRYPEQWALRNTGQTGGTPGADINAEAAWDITTGSSGVRIAILDTGLATQSEFAGRVLAGRNFTGGDNNDWVDRESHGTHVAGIAAARGNNSQGIAGVCWTCSLIVAKVLDDNNIGNTTQTANGLRWSADQGAGVINMSLGGPFGSTTLRDAVEYAWGAGAVLVASSGNTGTAVTEYPAGYDKVIAVGNTTHNDTLNSSSTTGPHLELSAPGTFILSTIPDGYGWLTGTSMASPHVAGLAGLILSANPSLSNQGVRDILRDSVDDLGPTGHDQGFGYGRINAGRAVTLASQQGVWVRFSYSGPMDGSYLRPYNTLAQGVNAAPCGGIVRVIGTSSQTGTFSRPAGCAVSIEAWSSPVTIGQ